jgi:hypothetical protein
MFWRDTVTAVPADRECRGKPSSAWRRLPAEKLAREKRKCTSQTWGFPGLIRDTGRNRADHLAIQLACEQVSALRRAGLQETYQPSNR